MRDWIRAFFAVSACSWMPHWSCHYYRIETDSSFVVGSFAFTVAASMVALAVYSAIILANVLAVIVLWLRTPVAIVSGLLHLSFAALHAYRLYKPFRFDVLGYPWSLSASLREVVIVGLFGLLSVAIGIAVTARAYPSRSS